MVKLLRLYIDFGEERVIKVAQWLKQDLSLTQIQGVLIQTNQNSTQLTVDIKDKILVKKTDLNRYD